MFGEKTLYRKIQVILDYAKEDKHSNKDSLIEYILGNRPTNFLYSWRDRNTDKIEHLYSRSSIENAIQVCIYLKLLHSETAVLTPRGRSATDPRRFHTIIGSSAKEYLEAAGLSMDILLNAIDKILHSAKPYPPTSDEIWESLVESEVKIRKEEFHWFITLLGQCQILSMSQKRIFLPWSGQH